MHSRYMRIMTPLFLFSTICALAYLPLAPRAQGALRSLVKTASVLGLSLSAGLMGAHEVALALALCALGDLLLSRDGDTAFIGGVAAFAAGHIAYILVFLNLPESDLNRLITVPTLWGALGLIGLGVAMASLLVPRAGPLRGPVLIYIPIILGMGLAALTLSPFDRSNGLLLAALAFIASDMILATAQFQLVSGARFMRLAPWLIWVLYWGAQAGFYLGLTGGGI